jgi:eukaryotic-like serine/threonine-protein kinase
MFASDKYGFSVSYAPGWDRKQGVAGAVVAFLTAQESASDTFRDNVTVVVQALPQGTTLQDYLDKSLADLPRFLKRFHLIEQQSSTLGGLPARTLHYTGETSGISLENRQMFAVAADRAYLITYSAEPSAYDRFLAGAQQIFDTFELTHAESGGA